MIISFGSVASGIEAASVAWQSLGWRAAWFSEIAPFPCAVLAHHYPTVPNLGDMKHLTTLIATGLIQAPDVLCGGTPCQAFSVAGLRQSLADDRGNLSLVFCEIANAIDDVRKSPAVIVWENVPGILSVKDNAFGCFLAGLAGENDSLVAPGNQWSNAGVVFGSRRTVAWRILDAQYFGLAQRRKRVFVVASARIDFDPVAVLFEFDGVRRDSAPSRKAGEGVAALAGSGIAFGGNNTSGSIDVATACNAHSSASGRMDFESETFIAHSLRGEGFDASEDGTGRGTPLVACYDTTQISSPANRSMPRAGDPCHPLAAGAHPSLLTFHCDAHATGALTASQHAAVAFSSKDYGGDAGPISPTLRSVGHSGSHANDGGQVAVAFQSSQSGVRIDQVQATLDANNGSRRHNGALTGMQVRRLTPRECERLQGFADDYTLVPNRGKPAADGPRYKALGNSWAVPVVTWIGSRIAAQLTP